MSGPADPNANRSAESDNNDETRLDATRVFPAVGGDADQQWAPPQSTQPQQAAWGQGQPPQAPQEHWAPPAAQQWGAPPSEGAAPQQAWGAPPPPGQQGWTAPHTAASNAPVWGPPQQQPPAGGPFPPGAPVGAGGSSKKVLYAVLGLVGVLVVAVLVVGVLSFAGGKKLDQSAVQDGVRRILTENYGIEDVADVTCPSGAKVEVGATFTCDVKVRGEDQKVTVKITKDDATYEVGQPS